MRSNALRQCVSQCVQRCQAPQKGLLPVHTVLQCATTPSLNIFQDAAILDWQPIVKVEHYRLRQDSTKHPVELKEDPPPYRTGGGQ